MEPAASPVKRAALALDLPITQPEKIKNNAEFRPQLESIAPDAILVVAYGRIIPQWMLDLPPSETSIFTGRCCRSIAVAAPIQWAIAMGENKLARRLCGSTRAGYRRHSAASGRAHSTGRHRGHAGSAPGADRGGADDQQPCRAEVQQSHAASAR